MRRVRLLFVLIALSSAMVALSVFVFRAAEAQDGPALTPIEELGKHLFFDENLSANGNQSCAFCHSPIVGYTGAHSALNATGGVYFGSHTDLFGNRKPPAAAYAGDSPLLHYDEAEEVWVGGMFWDGRATGERLGDPLAEQAQGPYLNPLEMALPDAAALCEQVAAAEYAPLFAEAFGAAPDCAGGVDGVYENIGRAVAAYERSAEVNPFSSKYDYYLAGEVELTEQEAWGLDLFNHKGKCAECHISEPGPNGEPPLFTDFTYDNLGVPRNPENPFYKAAAEFNPDGEAWVDPGLGGYLKSAGYSEDVYLAEWGKMKVPTLRNVAMRPSVNVVKAYTHNGYFKTLEDLVHFYNTRDVQAWPAPEIYDNVNVNELGNLGLTPEEEAALVAFMHTLTDGYQP